MLAHELAHEDLNHVAKAQVLGAGLNIGARILNELFPGSGAIAPLAGELVARHRRPDRGGPQDAVKPADTPGSAHPSTVAIALGG